jgi:hypothetical protein
MKRSWGYGGDHPGLIRSLRARGQDAAHRPRRRIAGYLEDPGIVQVMLNPGGRLWIDRLAGVLEGTGDLIAVLTERGSARRPANSASSRT